MNNDDDEPFTDHKLCGYLCAVLQLPNLTQTPPFGTPCSLSSDGTTSVCFNSQNDVVLFPIPTTENAEPDAVENGGGVSKKRRSMRKLGLVKGSMSVVQQLHVLTMHNCVKIKARVVGVDNGRAVVLVDVYLTIAVWSGWQFPRSVKVATALFKHLSCNWEERSLMLANNGNGNGECVNMSGVWNVSDCHVLGCKLRCGAPDFSKKRLFELDEIFKSLPSSVANRGRLDDFSRVKPADGDDNSHPSGIWDLADDILINILTTLGPMDLVKVAATCRHLRSLAASIMPCMKLKLFPHQQVAVEWMLQRERNAEILPHPLYKVFSTEDGFAFYVNTVTGHLVSGIAPTIRDFRGGMFCDEPGLGKTITALSLILKTQGTIPEPPDEVQTMWCNHNGIQRCGYYELNGDNFTCNNMSPGKRVINQNKRRKQISSDNFVLLEDLKCFSPKRARLMHSAEKMARPSHSSPPNGMKSSLAVCSEPATRVVRCTRSLSRIRKNLFHAYEEELCVDEEKKVEKSFDMSNHDLNGSRHVSWEKQGGFLNGVTNGSKKPRNDFVYNENWVQCDACRKWRRIVDASVADVTSAWFCSMNTDPEHQSCSDPEEPWDNCESITHLPGFCNRGTSGAKEKNISFFISVLKEQYAMIDSRTKKALTWLAKLSSDELSQMETIGLVSPVLGTSVGGNALGFHKIFQVFGLVRRVEKGITRWYYPRNLDDLVFDSAALRFALCEPLDSVRLYLSRATLIVVPANLVDHWKTQIQKHVRPGQLRLFVWTDHRKPSAHSLAWDYDIVITTFSRLSAEWGRHKKSALMQIHWLRIMLDEGHTLGGSLNLTNKLQMVVSLTASNRWLLTGTPTPNTPNSQLSHLQPMLKFLHEEAYGCDQKSWEAGILKPFDAEMEEGRYRLLQLLHRCMISARKIDLKTIPPCIKKMTFINFAVEHASTYNELVETVRRNILMADWNDPSHVESLLNPKQWKFRSATIRNIRLSCCVAGHIKVTAAAGDIQETMDLLVDNGLDSITEEYALIKYYLLYGGNCLRCNQWCRLPIITPCRHLLCLDCVSLDSEKCTLPGCGDLYEMQSPEILTRPENPNPKWPVPKDLIELQPSYKQDDWNPDWQSTASSKVSYLVERLKALQWTNKENGYSMDEDSDMKQKPLSASQISNSSALSQQHCFGFGVQSYNALPEKVLIFSQFLEHIHVVEQQLTIAGIKFATMYSPMHSSNKVKSLAMFQYDDSCMALLMDGTAALGLDLSFVTHVFLMEPIWDRSMEDQVISRAHRMGASRPIHVETLVMRGTIEEQMVKFLQDAGECRRFLKEEFRKSDNEGTRTHRTVHDFAESSYLSHLSFVRTSSKT